MLLSASTVASSSPITANGVIKDTVHAFVSCRLDYCNYLYAGLLDYDIAQLLSIQSASAHLFGGMWKYDSATPFLRDVLHWLPIKGWINFKIGVLTYKALNGLAPLYLSELLVLAAVNLAVRQNRSADHDECLVQRTPVMAIVALQMQPQHCGTVFLLSYVVVRQ